jgi:hypothetical protein
MGSPDTEQDRAGPPDFPHIGQVVKDSYVAETGDVDADTKAIAGWLRRAYRDNQTLRAYELKVRFRSS